MTTDQLALVALTAVGFALVLLGFVLGVMYCHSFDQPFSWLGKLRWWAWRKSYGYGGLHEVPAQPEPRSCVRLLRDEEETG